MQNIFHNFKQLVWQEVKKDIQYVAMREHKDFHSLWAWHKSDTLDEMLKYLGYESPADFIKANDWLMNDDPAFRDFADFYMDKVSTAQNIN